MNTVKSQRSADLIIACERKRRWLPLHGTTDANSASGMKRALVLVMVLVAIGCGSKAKPPPQVASSPAPVKAKPLYEIPDGWWTKPDGCPAGLEIYKRTDMIACLPACPDGAATSPQDPAKDCGRKYGPAVHLWPNGNVAWHGWYDSDARTGPWLYRYHTGEEFARGEYDRNDIRVPFTFTRRDGQPFFFDAGCPAGTTLERSTAYVGEPGFAVWCAGADGKQVAFASWNGDLQWSYIDAPDGNGAGFEWESAIRYYESTIRNGVVASVTKYELADHPNPREYVERNEDGKFGNHGAYKVWDRSDRLRIEGHYNNDCRDGAWIYRDVNGEVVSTATYVGCKVAKRTSPWHCTDAKHLLRASDLSQQVKVGRIDGIKETPAVSTAQLRGTSSTPFDVTLQLHKSNPEEYSAVWSDLYFSKAIEVVSEPGPGELADGSARVKVKSTGALGVAFFDQWLGAAVLLTCAEPACATHDDVVALAKTVHQRLTAERGCKK
jgi:hypothetical protein